MKYKCDNCGKITSIDPLIYGLYTKLSRKMRDGGLYTIDADTFFSLCIKCCDQSVLKPI